jgi:NAD(P)-dependent dehydrogenase (short-subunit alcohol dehydrogenase family)
VQTGCVKTRRLLVLVDFTLERYGKLDIAFNNAGIGGEANPTADYSVEGWNKLLSINLSGVFYCMKYELPAMLQTGGGAIVNMSSILGQVSFNNSPAYVASKHGVIGLTRTTATEYASQGIRVNAVGPGFIHTPLIAAMKK